MRENVRDLAKIKREREREEKRERERERKEMQHERNCENLVKIAIPAPIYHD